MIGRSSVSSSHLASIGHDPASGTLEVEFRNGAVWRYGDVSEPEYEDLLRSASRGRAFVRVIRSRKKGVRVG